ncbi:hypothetical protein SA2016_4120 (plasmid) [Sinomonas atrocyanea]|uniref:Uncharacterized protein n=1 Tax=Sinomonas atrocyanea TaxID=37927 RepID=A0A127AAR9_9MICC|nr:hypothetical protein [Sinomonas atrocyanea]AMM34772.1 hypothetical protein SA2016_4120 [Sinomonas atrocyanea]GEB64653.1 hypothetical protein SAT01_21010 [Sinomonas atrocyanea]GGG82495.1 hypothetical protein GCM10007172_40050 [Sinomonas atrocyanea]
MSNVFVEPLPKGSSAAATSYALEYAHGASVTGREYPTQQQAINAARQLGHRPLVARVRNTDKGNPDHWRAA